MTFVVYGSAVPLSHTVNVCFTAPVEVLAGNETVAVFVVSDVIGVIAPVIPVSDRTTKEDAAVKLLPSTVSVTLPPTCGKLAALADIPLTVGTAGNSVLLDE